MARPMDGPDLGYASDKDASIIFGNWTAVPGLSFAFCQIANFTTLQRRFIFFSVEQRKVLFPPPRIGLSPPSATDHAEL